MSAYPDWKYTENCRYGTVILKKWTWLHRALTVMTKLIYCWIYMYIVGRSPIVVLQRYLEFGISNFASINVCFFIYADYLVLDTCICLCWSRTHFSNLMLLDALLDRSGFCVTNRMGLHENMLNGIFLSKHLENGIRRYEDLQVKFLLQNLKQL